MSSPGGSKQVDTDAREMDPARLTSHIIYVLCVQGELPAMPLGAPELLLELTDSQHVFKHL